MQRAAPETGSSADSTALRGSEGSLASSTAPRIDLRDGIGARSADGRLEIVPERYDRLRSRLRYERFAKRIIDVVAATLLFVILLPLLLGITAALALTMGRPVVYRQQRVGKGGERFVIWKFRTMTADRRGRAGGPYVGPERRRSHKTKADPRITKVGGALRRWSLDELPQLWNVLRGDMSLVGPRPELVDIVDRYQPWQHLRHQVKPGITGLWQVSKRGDGLMHEHVALDLEYVEKVSFRTDVTILLRTIPLVIGRLPGF